MTWSLYQPQTAKKWTSRALRALMMRSMCVSFSQAVSNMFTPWKSLKWSGDAGVGHGGIMRTNKRRRRIHQGQKFKVVNHWKHQKPHHHHHNIIITTTTSDSISISIIIIIIIIIIQNYGSDRACAGKVHPKNKNTLTHASQNDTTSKMTKVISTNKIPILNCRILLGPSLVQLHVVKIQIPPNTVGTASNRASHVPPGRGWSMIHQPHVECFIFVANLLLHETCFNLLPYKNEGRWPSILHPSIPIPTQAADLGLAVHLYD